MSEATYKDLLDKQYEMTSKLTEGIDHIGEIAKSLKELQEKQTMKLDNLVLLSNNHTIVISSIEKTMGKLMMLMVIALIVLAGAKEVLPVLGK